RVTGGGARAGAPGARLAHAGRRPAGADAVGLLRDAGQVAPARRQRRSAAGFAIGARAHARARLEVAGQRHRRIRIAELRAGERAGLAVARKTAAGAGRIAAQPHRRVALRRDLAGRDRLERAGLPWPHHLGAHVAWDLAVEVRILVAVERFV